MKARMECIISATPVKVDPDLPRTTVRLETSEDSSEDVNIHVTIGLQDLYVKVDLKELEDAVSLLVDAAYRSIEL